MKERVIQKLNSFKCVHLDVKEISPNIIQTITYRTIPYSDLVEIGEMKQLGYISDFNLLAAGDGVIITLSCNEDQVLDVWSDADMKSFGLFLGSEFRKQNKGINRFIPKFKYIDELFIKWKNL